MWVIATKNLCTFLCKYKKDNKLSSTSDISKAFQFKSSIEAESYIINNLPKNTRSKYVVIKDTELEPQQEASLDIEWMNLRADDTLNLFKGLGDILKRAPAYRKVLELKKSQVEDALVDIYHYIEFHNVGTVQAYKIYKQEQELLQLRRKVKEELYCLDQLFKHIPTESVHVSDYIRSLDKSKDRAYIPKVLVDLFEIQSQESFPKDE